MNQILFVTMPCKVNICEMCNFTVKIFIDITIFSDKRTTQYLESPNSKHLRMTRRNKELKWNIFIIKLKDHNIWACLEQAKTCWTEHIYYV